MKRKLMIAVLVVMAMLAAALPAFAINYGDPDNGEHPYVGLMVADDADGNPLWRCSGTLISPTLFLTAGHCTESPAARATIWFEEDVQAGQPANGYPFGGPTSVDGTTYTHPQYDPNAFYLHDLGVVILDTPVVMDEYGELPYEGMLTEVASKNGKKDTTVEAVGYGLQDIQPEVVAIKVRLKATLKVVNLNGTVGIPDGTSVMVSGDAAHGGTCFGDSGGPQFLNGSRVVIAVTSFGLNSNCAGVGGGYRVDGADDLEWLYGTFADHLP